MLDDDARLLRPPNVSTNNFIVTGMKNVNVRFRDMKSVSRASDAEQPAWSCSVAAERAPVKEEPEWGERGVSAAAAAAGLYAGHEVKDEVVLGPELIQLQDVAYSMTSALNKTERDLFQLLPAGGECPRTSPGEGPRCSTSHEPQLKLRSCFVRLERFPIEDLHHNLHTHMNFRNHILTHGEACNGTGERNIKCNIYDEQCIKKTHITGRLSTHNAGEKLLQSSDDAEFVNTEVAPSENEIQIKNQNVSTTQAAAKPKPYKCDICFNLFSQKQSFLRHVMTIHIHREAIDETAYKYNCDTCDKRYTCQSQLAIHTRVHTGEKPFDCDICKKKFTYKRSLFRHKQMHMGVTGEKMHRCYICEKRFAHKGSLTVHMKAHSGIKPYSCSVCNKEFAQKSALVVHIRIHTGEKSYSCNICEKEFGRKSSLTKHRWVHTGKKRFFCSICKKMFARQDTLNVHVRLHTEKKGLTCDFCNTKFTYRSSLVSHMKRHTGEKMYECNTCNKEFTRQGYLNEHINIHTGEKPFSCDICNKRFTFKYHLNTHIKSHSGKKVYYSCNICKKKFATHGSLNRHRRIHTGEKPFACDICKKQFTRKLTLISHIQRHR